MNEVFMLGNFCRDPELRRTKNGTAVVNFDLAVPGKDRTDFIKCTAWGALAESVEKFVHKGDRVLVSGRLESSTYEKEGVKVYKMEVVCESIKFLFNQAPRDFSHYVE